VAAQYNDSKQALKLLTSLCPLAMQEQRNVARPPIIESLVTP
jgi:hypothetical protein